MINKDITEKIIAAALRVHTTLGPGLLESAYRDFLYHALLHDGWAVEEEKPMPVVYEGVFLQCGYHRSACIERLLSCFVKRR